MDERETKKAVNLSNKGSKVRPLSAFCLLSPVRPSSPVRPFYFVPCPFFVLCPLPSPLLSCAVTSVISVAVVINALCVALLILSLFLFFPSSYVSSISSFIFTSPFYQFSLSLPSFSSLSLLLSLGLLLSCLLLTRFHSLVSSPPLINPSYVSHNHNLFKSSSPIYIISYLITISLLNNTHTPHDCFRHLLPLKTTTITSGKQATMVTLLRCQDTHACISSSTLLRSAAMRGSVAERLLDSPLKELFYWPHR